MSNGYTNVYDEGSFYYEGLSLGGGAIYCSMCNLISLKNDYFENNYAKDGGSLIIAFDLAYEATLSNLTLDGCTFTNSKATNDGGSVYTTEKLDSVTNPGMVKLSIDLKSNVFT